MKRETYETLITWSLVVDYGHISAGRICLFFYWGVGLKDKRARQLQPYHHLVLGPPSHILPFFRTVS